MFNIELFLSNKIIINDNIRAYGEKDLEFLKIDRKLVDMLFSLLIITYFYYIFAFLLKTIEIFLFSYRNFIKFLLFKS